MKHVTIFLNDEQNLNQTSVIIEVILNELPSKLASKIISHSNDYMREIIS